MADKVLKRNVYVDGTLYGPDGEKPTAEVLKKIENPKAFEDVPDLITSEADLTDKPDADDSSPEGRKARTKPADDES